jgi:DNA ligase-1
MSSSVTLASKYDPEIHGTDLTNFLYSSKIDGMRCFWCTKTETLYTRNNNKINIPPEWGNELKRLNLPIDGELYSSNFSTTMSICRKKKCNIKEWENVGLFVFDLILYKETYIERYFKLKDIISLPFFISIVKHLTFSKTSCLSQKHNKAVEQGFEGLMIRRKNSYYEHSRSKNNLLKVKKFETVDAKVIGHQKGNPDGRYSHCMGALLLKTEENIDVFVGSGFNDDQRNNYKTYFPIGCIIEFKYFEKTKDNKYRFPIFVTRRFDKE